MNFIELFAGCGGLSLGLQSGDFDLVLANELSPMAAESYAFNFFNENLKEEAQIDQPKYQKTLWLNSKHPKNALDLRLRENPRDPPEAGRGISDLADDGSNLDGSLIVGSIIDLNQWLNERPEAAEKLKNGFGRGSIDLISGGPPCQSFSMAGLRKIDCEKNFLPWEFAKFVEAVEPKLVLLENVTGILRPFMDEQGEKHYAWFELAKAFSLIGYVPLCLHVNAKFVGVPQNRPRFILLGIRMDCFENLNPTFNKAERQLFKEPLEFYKRVNDKEEVVFGSLPCRDVDNGDDFALFEASFLSSLVEKSEPFVSVEDAIDDLRKNGDHVAKYKNELFDRFGKILNNREMKNHEYRKIGNLVRCRFRLYQNLQLVPFQTRINVRHILNGKTNELSDADWNVLADKEYVIDMDKFEVFKTKNEFIKFLEKLSTKKRSQRALVANQPAPAALSIPDDACHYHTDELRTLTVREMARIQSFPDNFEFRSKVTTGDLARRFEVPQYTQVGNAVPPLLARALGLAASKLLTQIKLNEKVQSSKKERLLKNTKNRRYVIKLNLDEVEFP